MEDGELDVEEGEVAVEGNAQCVRPSVPLPPESTDYNGVLPQRKPKKAKLAKAVAAGYFDVYGSQARAAVQLLGSRAIRPLDVQGLLLWVLADGMNPNWCFVKNKALVSKVVVVGMPGLDADLYMSRKEHMPIMHAQLGAPATVLAKSAQVRTGSTLATLFTVPVSKKRKRDSDQQQQLCHEALHNGKQVPFPPEHYTMTLEQMEANNYPLPEVDDEGHMTCPAGFMATQPAGGEPKSCLWRSPSGISWGLCSSAALSLRISFTTVMRAIDQGRESSLHSGKEILKDNAAEEQSPQDIPLGGKTPLDMVSLDCEMCSTAEGLELTRASLVDSQGQVLLDELVLPENAIIDYNTQFSGITQQALATVTTSLADIQKRVCEFLSAETLLIGHGLENDLRALKIIHANCLDTSVLYPHPKGPPCKPALRILAERYLRRTIQQGEHDSVIDACAALDLVKLKVARGPAYGTYLQGEQGDKLMDVLHRHKKRCTLVDRTDMLNRHVTAGASAVIATSDDEALSKVCKEVAKAGTDFVWTQLRSLGTFLGSRAAYKQQRQRAQPLSQQPGSQEQQVQPTVKPTAGTADHCDAATPTGTNRAGLQGDCDPPQDAQAMVEATQHESNGAIADARSGRQLDNSTAANGAADHANGPDAPNGSVKKKKERTASTTEEHTESHKYVKTERDGSGSQQSTAEVVQKKTTTQVHKRKREETFAGGGTDTEVDPSQTEADTTASPSQQSGHTEQGKPGNGQVAGAQGCRHDRHPADTASGEQAAGACSNGANQDVSEEQLDKTLEGLDKCVGSIIEALPVNGLLVVFTCQGDTAEYRRMQEDKLRRQAGLEKLRPWTSDDEAKMAPTASRVCRALCFSYVKL